MTAVLEDGKTEALLGVDTSNVQGYVLDAARAKTEGVDFAIFKASQGLTFNDAYLRANRDAAQKASMPLGAYHYLESGHGDLQAKHYINYVNANGGFQQIGAFVDFELQSANVGPSAADGQAFVSTFHALEPGKPLLFYTGAWYINGYVGGTHVFSNLPLWVSAYVGGAGLARDLAKHVTPGFFVPFGGWTHYALRQFTSTATVAGRSPVDASIYPGTLAGLKQLFGIAPRVNPVPSPAPAPVPSHPFARLTVDGHFGALTIRALQTWLHVHVDGICGRQTITALEHTTGATPNGVWDTDTTKHLQTWLNTHFNQRLTVDGVFGVNTCMALQKYLNARVGRY